MVVLETIQVDDCSLALMPRIISMINLVREGPGIAVCPSKHIEMRSSEVESD